MTARQVHNEKTGPKSAWEIIPWVEVPFNGVHGHGHVCGCGGNKAQARTEARGQGVGGDPS